MGRHNACCEGRKCLKRPRASRQNLYQHQQAKTINLAAILPVVADGNIPQGDALQKIHAVEKFRYDKAEMYAVEL